MDKQPMYLFPRELMGDLTAGELRDLKKRVVVANRAMGYWYQQMGRDCSGMTTGHVSARVPGTDTFVTKGRAPEQDLMSEVTLQKLVHIDIPSREKVAGEIEVATMGEIELHACIYEARPDVMAVCHAHADYTIMCGQFGLKLKAFSMDGIDYVLNGYGVYDKPYMIASPETGVPMAEALGRYNAVILAGHGATTVSTRGPEEAMMRIIGLENLCKKNWLAFSAVGRDYEKYAFSEETIREGMRLSSTMKDRYDTPGKDLTVDQCRYNAAMARLMRESLE